MILFLFSSQLDDTSPRLQEKENQTVGTLGFTPTKEPKASGLDRAAQRSRDSGAPSLTRRIALNNKLKKEVEDLKKKLEAKEDESQELKAKLDRRDIEHQNHLDTTLKELTKAHRIEMEKKEVSFNERAQQWEDERRTFDHEMKRLQEQFVQENERYTMSLKRTTNAESEVIKETLQEKEKKATLLETANQTIKELKQNRDAQLAAHKQEIKRKDVQIRKAEVQVKEQNDKQTQSKRKELQQQQIDAITQEHTKQWEAIIESLEAEHKEKMQQIEENHSNKITTLTREHQEEIEKARSNRQQQPEQPSREKLEKEVRDEYEQRRDEDIQKAKTEESERWQTLNQKLKDEYEQKLNQIRGDHIQTLAEKTQKHKEEVAALRGQARQLELKYLKNGDYVAEEVIEHRSPSTSPEQGRHARKIDQPHQMIADINLEKDNLKTELAAQQQRVCDLQHELDHQKEQYGQLEIQAMAKQQLSLSLSPTDSEGDVS